MQPMLTIPDFAQQLKLMAPGGAMEKKSRDSAVMTAWITGGLALAGTVITLIVTGPLASSPPPPTNAPPSTTTTASTTPAPTSKPAPPATESSVPEGVEGQWVGGSGSRTNLHLVISRESEYLLRDDDQPGVTVGKGKLTFDGSTINFYDVDKSIGSYPWSVRKSPVGDILQIGNAGYRRE
jgi:hypothetical protein